MTMASRVSRLSENPIARTRNSTPISDSGMVTSGMMTTRREPRKRKITSTTMSAASTRVVATSRSAASMGTVESQFICSLISAGSAASIPGMAAFTARPTASGLASGAGVMAINMAGSPLENERKLEFSLPSSTSATSPRRTRSSPFWRTTSSAKACGLWISVRASTSIRISSPSVAPVAAM